MSDRPSADVSGRGELQDHRFTGLTAEELLEAPAAVLQLACAQRQPGDSRVLPRGRRSSDDVGGEMQAAVHGMSSGGDIEARRGIVERPGGHALAPVARVKAAALSCASQPSDRGALGIALCIDGPVRAKLTQFAPELAPAGDSRAAIEDQHAFEPFEVLDQSGELGLDRPSDPGGGIGFAHGVVDRHRMHDIAQVREANEQDALWVLREGHGLVGDGKLSAAGVA